jgi:cysteinyl-tRNA synthetase
MVAVVLFSGCKKEKITKENAMKMQEFVINIAQHARQKQQNFIIIPQNGCELAFSAADPEEGINYNYLNAIDGMGIEELFYNGSAETDNERLDMLRQIKNSEKILVSDYVSNNSNAADATQKNRNEGFVPFVRTSNNYDYIEIPALTNANHRDITQLSEIENYLYLIGTDNFGTKESFLNAISATDYDLVLIDLFFEEVSFSAADIARLKTKANGGKRLVIAYISIGSAENYRYYWQSGWKKGNPSWLKKRYEGYPDEFWVEYWHSDWQSIIFDYIDKIITAGFDGAYLDNVEAYYFLEH